MSKCYVTMVNSKPKEMGSRPRGMGLPIKIYPKEKEFYNELSPGCYTL